MHLTSRALGPAALCLACCTNAAHADPLVGDPPGPHPVEDFLDYDKVKAMPELPHDLFEQLAAFKPDNLAATGGKLRKFTIRTEWNDDNKTVTTQAYTALAGHPGYYTTHTFREDGQGPGTSGITTNQFIYLNLIVVANETDSVFHQNPKVKGMIVSGYTGEMHLPSDFGKALTPGGTWHWDRLQVTRTAFTGGTIALSNESHRSNYACTSGTPIAASAIYPKFTGDMVPVSCEQIPDPDKAPPKAAPYQVFYLKDYGIFLPKRLMPAAAPEATEPGKKPLPTFSLVDVELGSD